MGKIAVMPDALASQVAAGEVVERPASVVRELLDNALDAGARNIEVVIVQGGAGLIRVTDDGAGMSRDDAVMSIERHATSKIREFADLAKVMTLGFRGEALPSIASVSRFKLRSREHGALSGTCVEIDGGRLIEVRDDGGAPGTVVEVKSLFMNVPARRKFLKADNTEFGHVDQQVRLHAIAHPEVGFKLVRDGRAVLTLPATNDTLNRVRGLVGDEIAGGLKELKPAGSDDVEVRGLISKPGVSRPNRRMQWVFLNGRPVESPALFRSIKEAYRGRIERDGYPLAFLFLTLPPETVDVNVHPAKKEVRFHRSGLVERVVYDALVAALDRRAEENVAPAPSAKAVTIEPREDSVELDELPSVPTKTPKPSGVPDLRLRGEALAPSASQPELPAKDVADDDEVESAEVDEIETEDEEEVVAGIPADFAYRGLLSDGYVLFETDDGLAMLHIRAARERIIYERLAAVESTDSGAAQRLLLPVTIETEQEEYEAIVESMEDLRTMGLDVEEFGARTFKIAALPAGLRQINAADVIRELFSAVAALRRGESGTDRDGRRRKLLMSVARVLSKEETGENLVSDESGALAITEQLFQCGMPYCCPRGRPTLVHIGYPELARRFSR